MRLRPNKRDPWGRPRGERLRSGTLLAACVLVFVLTAVVFVDIVQPFAFDLVGRAVNALGGGDLAASIVVWGLYLAAVASAWIWGRLEQTRGLGRWTVTFGILAAPLWLGAIAVTPPSRYPDDAARLISGHVGDARLGATIHQAVSTGLILVLVVVGIRWLLRRTLLRSRVSYIER
jgi:hypothetical protein